MASPPGARPSTASRPSFQPSFEPPRTSFEPPLLEADDADQSGPCAGLVEAFSLFWIVPGFFRFALFVVLMGGGVVVPWVYILPPLQQTVWGDKAASYTSWMQAGRSFLSMLIAPYFGAWSDNKGRRLVSLVMMTTAGFCIGIPELLLGSTETSLWISVVLIIASGPFAVQLSGSPVLWAYAADILPVQHRETGFAIIMASTSFGTFFIQVVAKFLAGVFPHQPSIYYWVTFTCFGLSLMLLASLWKIVPCNVDMVGADDIVEEEPERPGLLASLFAPLKMLQGKPTLRAICIVAAVLTFADLAASDVSAQLLYEMVGIDHGTTAQQQEASFYYVALPSPFVVLTMIFVGVASRRFSPHRFVRVWLPITSVLFAMPAFLSLYHPKWAILIAGYCSIVPLSNYGPLQSLVVHVVPASKIGAAQGTLQACKNICGCLAPFAMGAIATYLDRTGNNDKLWVIYPGCALVMLAGWPFTWLFQKRVELETRTVWSSWASVARPTLTGRTSSWRLSNVRPSIATQNLIPERATTT